VAICKPLLYSCHVPSGLLSAGFDCVCGHLLVPGPTQSAC
jgi:hypothetical protein